MFAQKIIYLEKGYFQLFLILQLMRCKKDESVHYEVYFYLFQLLNSVCRALHITEIDSIKTFVM